MDLMTSGWSGAGVVCRWHASLIWYDSLGHAVGFHGYVRQMQGATGGLFEVFTKVKAAQASIERLQEILKSEDIVPRGAECVDHFQFDRRRGAERLRFEKVTFGYEPGRAVLENITLTAASRAK